MSPAEASTVLRLRLAADIERDLTALNDLSARCSSLHSRLQSDSTDWVCSLALAFEVERYYTGLEALLERLLRELDGQQTEGPRRHQEILRAALTPLEPHRPSLLPSEVATDVRELLAFRHVARHAYEAEPDPVRMLLHGARLVRVQCAIEPHLRSFAARLRAEAGAR